MKISSASLATLLIAKASAFVVPSPTFAKNTALRASSEFDYLLGEGTELAVLQKTITSDINTNNIISLPDSSAAATLTSSVTFEEATGAAADLYSDGMEEQIAQEGETKDPRIAEIIRKEQQQIAMKSQPVQKPPMSVSVLNYLKGKDFGEIFFTVLVPVIAGYYFLGKAYTNVSGRVDDKAEETLDAYANEMIYHDGDFEEMKMAHDDYSKRLVFLGTKKTDAMIKRYLEFYAKKKTVSPQAISSLSHAFSIYKFTEERAADILSETCVAMPDKVASAGKLLFFGEHILKTKEGKAKLQPIRDLLSSTYEGFGDNSGQQIVEKSQIAMGEAAYKAAVQTAGKNQSELTIGWEVLGLDKETATTIFNEVAKDGFLTGTQAKYGAKQQKFDAKGRKLDDDEKLVNPEEAANDEDESVGSASGNVQECTECGFTLFVAQGRDFKFFNSGFTCPECGASKDKFKAPDMD